MRATTPFEFRSLVLDPAVNRALIHVQSTFPHDFFEIARTERRAQIPTDAQENNFWLEVAPFEGILLGHAGSSFALFCRIYQISLFFATLLDYERLRRLDPRHPPLLAEETTWEPQARSR
jgi:hypothetical protein